MGCDATAVGQGTAGLWCVLTVTLFGPKSASFLAEECEMTSYRSVYCCQLGTSLPPDVNITSAQAATVHEYVCMCA
jgi:hypothetical protein